jgi:hypothetical protein
MLWRLVLRLKRTATNECIVSDYADNRWQYLTFDRARSLMRKGPFLVGIFCRRSTLTLEIQNCQHPYIGYMHGPWPLWFEVEHITTQPLIPWNLIHIHESARFGNIGLSRCHNAPEHSLLLTATLHELQRQTITPSFVGSGATVQHAEMHCLDAGTKNHRVASALHVQRTRAVECRNSRRRDLHPCEINTLWHANSRYSFMDILALNNA